MRRNLLTWALALSTAAAVGCGGSGKSGSGSTAGTAGVSYDINVVKPTGGYVTASGPGIAPAIDCGYMPVANGDHNFCGTLNVPWSTTATLQAAPAAGYKFKQW